MADRRPRVYLAGPDVFYPDAPAIAARKREICARYGLEGCFPLDNVVALDAPTPAENAFRINDANIELMNSCDAIIANMTPFRGPGMDGGTAFEMGYMRAQGKVIVGYTNDGREYAVRVKNTSRAIRARGNGTFEDQDGLLIEDFGLADNLMMHCGAMRSGGDVVVGNAGALELQTSLEAFEHACALLAEKLRA